MTDNAQNLPGHGVGALASAYHAWSFASRLVPAYFGLNYNFTPKVTSCGIFESDVCK